MPNTVNPTSIANLSRMIIVISKLRKILRETQAIRHLVLDLRSIPTMRINSLVYVDHLTCRRISTENKFILRSFRKIKSIILLNLPILTIIKIAININHHMLLH